jgi:hypothetical protein
MRWVGHVTNVGDTRNAYNILVRKSERKKSCRRPWHGWKRIKLDWILGKQGGKMQTGRIGTSGKPL